MKKKKIGEEAPMDKADVRLSSLSQADKPLLQQLEGTRSLRERDIDSEMEKVNDGEKVKELAEVPLFSRNSHRLRISFLLFLINVIVVSARVILSISIVAMVHPSMLPKTTPHHLTHYNSSSTMTTALAEEDEEELEQCKYNQTAFVAPTASTGGESLEGTLLWSASDVSVLLAATFYGTVISVWLAGPLVDSRGPKVVLTGAVVVCSVVSLISPVVATRSYWAFFVCRLLIGMVEAFVMPALSSLGAHWFPSGEKSTVVALYSSGTQVGAGFSSFVAAAICGSTVLGGWPAVFYIYGILGVATTVLLIRFASDSPSQNEFISTRELKFLEAKLPTATKKSDKQLRPSWRELLFSPAVLAIQVCFFAFGFTVALMHSFLPSFINEKLRLPLQLNGLYTMTPFMAQIFSKMVMGPVMDMLVRRKILSQTATVRVAQGIAGIGSSLAFVGLATLPSCSHPEVALGILIIFGIVFAGGSCGFYTSLLTIAPSMTGKIAGFGGLARMAGTVSATSGVAYLAKLETPHKWKIIFLITSTFQVVATIVFLFFGSGKVQSWALPTPVAPREDVLCGKKGKEGSERSDDHFSSNKC